MSLQSIDKNPQNDWQKQQYAVHDKMLPVMSDGGHIHKGFAEPYEKKVQANADWAQENIRDYIPSGTGGIAPKPFNILHSKVFQWQISINERHQSRQR